MNKTFFHRLAAHLVRIVATGTLAAGSIAASAQGTLSLSYTSQTGDFVGQGVPFSAGSPQWTVTSAQVLPDGLVRLQMQGPSLGDHSSLDIAPPLAPPPALPLAVGHYADAARASFRGTSSGLDFSSLGRGCNKLTGNFDVLDIQFGSGNTVNALAVNFEQHCEGVVPALFGQLRYNSGVPVDPATIPATPLAFAPRNGVAPSTLITSELVTVSGLSGPATMNVSGGAYSYNGGAFSTSPQTVQNGDHVQVRVVSSATAGASATATLTIGSQSAPFTVTSYAAGSAGPATTFRYRSTTGDYVGQGKSDTYTIQNALFTVSTEPTTNGFHLSVVGPAGINWDVLMSSPTNALLTPGTYTAATRYPFNAAGTPGLDMFGDGRGCNNSFGQFTVYEATFAPDGTPQTFSADFEQHCEQATAPALYGEVRVNSTRGTSFVPDPVTSITTSNPCFLVDSDHDGIPDCLELPVGTNPGVKDNNVFASAQLFVMQQYRDFLQRESEFVGATYWIQQLTSGAVTRTGMVKTFLASPEFGGTVAPVARLYFAYLTRLPDAAGLRYWSGQVQNGASLETVSDAFATSPEFAATYGSLDNSQFVDLVYNNILGRPADTTGHAYWQGQLDTATMTRGQVMLAFSESAEFHALIDNDVYVTMLYLSMLQRAPDSAGFTYWTAYLDAGNPPDALIDLFLGSAEYRARFLP